MNESSRALVSCGTRFDGDGSRCVLEPCRFEACGGRGCGGGRGGAVAAVEKRKKRTFSRLSPARRSGGACSDGVVCTRDGMVCTREGEMELGSPSSQGGERIGGVFSFSTHFVFSARPPLFRVARPPHTHTHTLTRSAWTRVTAPRPASRRLLLPPSPHRAAPPTPPMGDAAPPADGSLLAVIGDEVCAGANETGGGVTAGGSCSSSRHDPPPSPTLCLPPLLLSRTPSPASCWPASATSTCAGRPTSSS